MKSEERVFNRVNPANVVTLLLGLVYKQKQSLTQNDQLKLFHSKELFYYST